LSGVISFRVSQRTREIGIRMALGARGRDVLLMVLGQGLKLIAIGLAVGIAAASAGSRVIRALLFDTPATDPVTFVGRTNRASCWEPGHIAIC
jgi:putative ABC transport system permease protein